MVDFSDKLDEAASVVNRFLSLEHPLGSTFESYDSHDRLGLIMDMLAADGVNGNEAIDWSRLASFDDFNLTHDVCGIHNCMNRETGALEKGFLPRASRSTIAPR